ncbi:unnamed protein product [Caenorhabditis auriculariae]|uniref:Rho-GAP domain-containing protein n=1 Tax=Caenorhabditis auriculariae TaxID=2777116 RepID=A0A8S1GPH6_9PELO|nr:unnamed protein product [Caenorhabditis auriculariae]
MDVGQKLRRMKHNLVNSSKKEEDVEIKAMMPVEVRNQKIISAVGVFKKDVASTIRTGLREDNVDKRRKKLEEHAMALNLREIADELDAANTTCMHKVVRKVAEVMQSVASERVKQELKIENRVLDELTKFQEIEKQLSKSREKLSNAYTDLEIAQKALEKADGQTAGHQEAVDVSQLKLEHQKDNVITEVYLLATKEKNIALTFAAYLEEQLEYHRQALTELQKVLPEIRQDIHHARPCPVFGVDLAEHLRQHYPSRLATVIEKCCTLLRKTGFTEKGLFRVNGNNSKIRRAKAAFDAGHFDADEKASINDPNSISSVLKLYLRELPDPLLTRRLQNDWCTAVALEGEQRLRALESCIASLPQANFDNLTYLMHFLSDMLYHQDVTAMTAGNLAIVIGPNLLGSDLDGNNAIGTKVVEMLIVNAARFFGIPSHDPTRGFSPQQEEHHRLTDSRADNISTVNINPMTTSKMTRPKEKAPPPPGAHETTADNLIDLSDTWSSENSFNNSSPLEKRYMLDRKVPDRPPIENEGLQRAASADSVDSFDEYFFDDTSLTRSMTDKPHRPPPPTFRSPVENPHGRPMSYHLAVVEPGPSPSLPQRQRSMVVANPLAIRNPAQKTMSTSMMASPPSIVNGENNKTVVNVDGSASLRVKPPLPIKPKPDFGEASRL